ncbi:MAG: Hsp20/alpha crystallin family protein [Syntrophales bacterium LBB04]|nr:Hsp20/alpha crystallin family protein [Syntrophales bacterium LBB04]
MKREDFSPFYPLQRDMNRIFDDFFTNFSLPTYDGLSERFEACSPSTDIREDEKELTIKAELPGMDEKDIEVSLTDDTLTIAGEKKDEKEEKSGGYYYAERSYGSFRRVLPLPASIDSQKADASFKKGVLTITVPKTEAAKSKVKKIAIKTE